MRSGYHLPVTVTMFIGAVVVLVGLTVQPASAQNSPQIPITNANWAGIDDLGRKLPSYEEVGDPKPNRWVGLFYWQWHGKLRCFPNDYNITEFLKTHPGFRDFKPMPEGGPAHPTWYWAEPLFGYYKATDPWVIRKHIVLLADAGVDFLFYDYTNSTIFDPELTAFLEVAEELKSKGVQVPRLVFFLNFKPEWKIEALYKTWYRPGKYDDMWFKWQGKPLMLAVIPTDPAKFSDPSILTEIQQYFTWRPTWAHDAKKWSFIAVHPQRPFKDANGKVEQLCVSKSIGAPVNNNMEIGSVSYVPGSTPTYDDQWLSKDCAKGLFFQEQWKVAHEIEPPILLVTGWNEWHASVWGRVGIKWLGKRTVEGEGYLVDQFNMEFNRDIEPMKGGYWDNYYMQFVSNMRRYKGMQAPEKPSEMKTVRIDGKFEDWSGVKPVYTDAASDIANRDFDATVPNIHYTNTSARNDITRTQVARDRKNIYFHVQTASPLTPLTDRNWMMLLIDSDCDVSTGWYGYDLLINRTHAYGMCSVERNVGGEWKWQKAAGTAARHSGSDIELAISRKLFTCVDDQGGLRIDFKWVDNIPYAPIIADFYSEGDAAPDGRFNYRYEVKAK